MLRRPKTVLGVNPGTRYLAVAVVQGSELRDWRIKGVSGKEIKEKVENAKRMLGWFIERYGVDVLIIKELHPARGSANLKKLVSSLKSFARRKGLRVYEYTIDQVKECFDEAANKRELAEMMVECYSALQHELMKERSNRNSYHIRVFEAVALAAAYLSRLRGRRDRNGSRRPDNQ